MTAVHRRRERNARRSAEADDAGNAQVIALNPTTIAISDVSVGERGRKYMGDLPGLIESIKTVGLINPITLTIDNQLVCGARRLEACRQLGWTSIPFTRLHSRDDAILQLLTERDENTCHKPMCPSELVALGRKLEALERPRAKQRQRDGQQRGRDTRFGSSSVEPEPNSVSTDQVVGEALGISQAHYKRLKFIAKAAAETLSPEVAEVARQQQELLDQGRISVTAAAAAVRDAKNGLPVGQSAPDIDQLAEPDTKPIPIGRKRGPQRIRARAEARHSLVAVAIALQTTARQISSINTPDLEFSQSDSELNQAPEIIAAAVKEITHSLKEIKHVRNA